MKTLDPNSPAGGAESKLKMDYVDEIQAFMKAKVPGKEVNLKDFISLYVKVPPSSAVEGIKADDKE